MKIKSNINTDTTRINLEICNNDLIKMINVSKYTDIWQYLVTMGIEYIRGKEETECTYYYFFNSKNELGLTIKVNKRGIKEVRLYSITKSINIVMTCNIEYNAFYDLLDLFLRSDEKINIGTLNKIEKKEAN